MAGTEDGGRLNVEAGAGRGEQEAGTRSSMAWLMGMVNWWRRSSGVCWEQKAGTRNCSSVAWLEKCGLGNEKWR